MKLISTPNAIPPGSSLKAKNLQIIDQLRGVAVLLVIVHHLFGINFGHWDLPWLGSVRDFAAFGYKSMVVHLFYLGWAGVPLFFVLSGFCIHWSCMRWDRFEIRRFLWQRFWRIYPVYLITLILFGVVELRDEPLVWASKQFLSHLFLIHNFWDGTFAGINGPFWSLAVEMQLYLLYPLLLVIRQRAGWRGCFLIAGSMALLWRLAVVVVWGLPDDGVTAAMASPLNTWLDWSLGAWIAERYAAGQRAFPGDSKVRFLALVCFVISTIYRPLTLFSFFLASLTSALWLDRMLHSKALLSARPGFSSLVSKGLVWFGLISYSLYLWHEPIVIHWQSFIATHVSHAVSSAIRLPLSTIPAFFFAVLIAYLSFNFLEKPAIRLGQILFKLPPSNPRQLTILRAQADPFYSDPKQAFQSSKQKIGAVEMISD
jgi:peptidoglycan/LPS O-acetylase OafA/YrhL